MFILNPTIEADSHFVADLPLCTVRLHKNAAWPWLMLLPRRHNMVEYLDLSPADRDLAWAETLLAAEIVKKLYVPKKLNIANLGNVVSQLHIHVIARYEDDPAWPGPVWNSGQKAEYTERDLTDRLGQLQVAFAPHAAKT